MGPLVAGIVRGFSPELADLIPKQVRVQGEGGCTLPAVGGLQASCGLQVGARCRL